jgi:long-subunit fatty acid transport protein
VRALAFAVVIGLCARASGYPFFAPRPVPNAIAGAADPHVAAIFYNPAALAPLRGLHLYLEGGPRLYEGSIDRSSVEGRPGGSARINDAGFDAFVGLAWDLGTNSITIGLATYAPMVDLSSFGDSPVRYHAIDSKLVVWEQTLAAAIKISSRFFFGATANFAESWLYYKYARDAALAGGTPGVDQPGGLCGAMACGLENPAAAETVRLRGFGWGIGFTVGILTRPIDRLWIGLSYTSHVFNTGAAPDFPIESETGARIRPAGGAAYDGGSRVTVVLPDFIYLATRVELTPTVDVEGSLRWVHYGARSQLDVKTQGGTLGQLDPTLALPPEFLLDRGLQDAFAVEASGRFRVGQKLRLSPSFVFESSAVEASAVSAAALEAPKIDLALTAEWRPRTHLVLGAHVGGTAYVLGDVSSRFHPRDQTRCVDARYDLAACGAVESGGGLPSASGHYTLFVVHFGAAIGVDY